jgi:single-strand DNA-binding protein
MYNETEVLGNLGGDPELKFTPTGQAVCSFSVATNRKWTGQDGQQHEETTWFRVSVWDKMGEACNKYLKKGQQVFVKGRLVPDKETGGPRLWTGQDGQQRASFELRALTVKFLGGGAGDGNKPDRSRDDTAPLTEDEIPF